MPASLRLLAIDSSTDTLSVALGSGSPGGPIWQHTGPGAATASATLLPVVQSLLTEADWSLSGLDAIVFGRGPGSFTGLRTACAVAQGLAYGARSLAHPAGLPVLPVDTLLALAEAARSQRERTGQPLPAVIAALLDARMGELYVALYAVGPHGLLTAALQAPRLCAPVRLAEYLRQSLPSELSLDAGDCLLAGNVWDAYADALADLPGPVERALPSATALLALAPALLADGQGVAAQDALPVYVRDQVAQTSAERERQRLAAQRTAPLGA